MKYLKYTKGKELSLRKYSRWPWASKMEFLRPYLPLKCVKMDCDSEDRDDSNEIFVEQVENQEMTEDDEEENNLFDVLQVKRAKMQTPEDVMVKLSVFRY